LWNKCPVLAQLPHQVLVVVGEVVGEEEEAVL
jgi:hypothetical protein